MLPQVTPRYIVGQCTFDNETELLYDTLGNPIHLRNQSFRVLRLLLEKPQKLVRRDYIFEAIWKNRHVTDDSLTQCITDIRRVISDTQKTILVTVHTCGYRLMCSEQTINTPASFRWANSTTRLNYSGLFDLPPLKQTNTDTAL